MQSKLRIFASFLLVFSLTLGLFLTLSPKGVVATDVNVCPKGNGWIKFDLNDNAKEKEYNAGSGYIVSEVCVKGGSTREYFSTDATKSCWVVTGIGTQISKAKENWNGNNKGHECKDISHVSFKVEKKYVQCTQTTESTGEWSEWMTDPKNKYMEYRERTIYQLDSVNSSIVCSSETEKETRKKKYEMCSKTYTIYGRWSEWEVDPEDSSKEYRERTITIVDFIYRKHICSTDVKKQYRDVEYKECSATTESVGEWSEWIVDPSNRSMFVRERVVSNLDSKNSEVVCSTEIEKDYKERDLCPWETATYADDPLCLPAGEGEDDEGDVQGVTTEVKGTTTVVLAATAAGDRSAIYLIQSLLMLVTGMSLIYVGKQYLNRV